MRLHESDCHLESARLALATGDRASARRKRETAKAMVEEMGYLRRDEEVREIERQWWKWIEGCGSHVSRSLRV